jgi:hypothetical protein
VHPPHMPQRITLALLATLVVLAGIAVVLLARHDWGNGSGNNSTPSETLQGSNTTKGSGVTATQTRNVPAFTGVDLAGANNVTVHVGGPQRVVVHADDTLLRRVTTVVRDRRLVIGNTAGSFSTTSPMSVDVTVPSLDSATLSGSGVVTVDGLHATRFTVDVPGNGVVRVSGRADRLNATLGGSGDVELQDLMARDVTALVAGSGRLQVHATGSLDAAVSGVGAISYTGSPSKVSQKITGTGSITSGSSP